MGGIRRFLSTPSARRATLEKLKNSPVYIISIHALREEGDEGLESDGEISIHALREEGDPALYVLSSISIHALREEGDDSQGRGGISIHALREEGDASKCQHLMFDFYFYPRPPRGGRPEGRLSSASDRSVFLSTPSARRATTGRASILSEAINFYPRPPRGGRLRGTNGTRCGTHFYPRPPRGGRPA